MPASPIHINPLPSSIDGLHPLEEILAREAADRLSLGDAELFGQAERMLKLTGGAVLVFRNEDLRRLGPDPRLANVPASLYVKQFFSGPPDDPLSLEESDQIRRFQDNQLFTAPPEIHRLMKPIMAKPFMPSAMPPFRAIIEDIAEELLEQFAGAGEIDFQEDFAQPLAFKFWARLFQMTDEETERLREIMIGMAANGSRRHRSREGLLAYNAAIPEYVDLLVAVFKRAREGGPHAVLDLRAEQFAGIVSPPSSGMPESMEVALASDMIDGFHALGVAMANCLYALLVNPDAYQRLRQDQGLVADAVTEGLRLYAPVRLIARYALTDIDYDGMLIPAGSCLWMYWGGGNRDPSVYDEPNSFKLLREQVSGGTFGGGAQLCPGRNIVRTMAVACLSKIVRPDILIRLTSDSTWMLGQPLTGGLSLDRMLISIERI